MLYWKMLWRVQVDGQVFFFPQKEIFGMCMFFAVQKIVYRQCDCVYRLSCYPRAKSSVTFSWEWVKRDPSIPWTGTRTWPPSGQMTFSDKSIITCLSVLEGVEADISGFHWDKCVSAVYLFRYPIEGKIKTNEMKVNWWVYATSACLPGWIKNDSLLNWHVIF